MKNKFVSVNRMAVAGRFGLASAALVLMAIVMSSSASPAPEVLPPSSLPYGYSYEEWSAKYWQWTLGQSTNHYELVGNPEICSGPASRVGFPGPSRIGSEDGAIHIETNHITIAAGTPLFFAVFALWNDNGNCPLSAFGTNTPAQLAAIDEQQWSAVTETTCTIDGVEVGGMEDPTNSVFNVVSPPFSYTTAEKDNVIDPAFGVTCIPGDFTIYPAVAEGLYVMIAPLSPGRHTIHTVAVVGPLNAPLALSDRTEDITVLPFE